MRSQILRIMKNLASFIWSIEAGKNASLCVFSKDLLTIPDTEIMSTEMLNCMYKGISLESPEQEYIRKMMDHINSYTRKNLGDRSAYQVFSFLYDEETLEKLHATVIPADEIILKPRLLRK